MLEYVQEMDVNRLKMAIRCGNVQGGEGEHVFSMAFFPVRMRVIIGFTRVDMLCMAGFLANTVIQFYLNLLFELYVVIQMLFLAHESGLSLLRDSPPPALWLCSCALSHQGINGSSPESS